MPSTPLVVAAVAGVLLVVVIGADVAYNRTLFVDARTAPGSWATVAQDPCCRAYEYLGGPYVIEANRSDDVTLRLRVDNGYPLAYEESFVVRAASVEIHRGVLQAPAGSEGVAEFSVPAATFLGHLPDAAPPPEKGLVYGIGAIVVEIDGKQLYVSPGIREVAK